MRKGLIGAATASALIAAPAAAWAKTDPATWVARILSEWDDIQARDGWIPQGAARPGRLASGAEERLEYPLTAGTTYRFVVVCEADCGAGDVELMDPAGARVGEPRPLVEMPKLEAAPTAPGTYRLRVAMTDCALDTCVWSARLYARTGPPPKRRK
ncbi:MAG TPA: hypothetical protein VGB04_00090 [Allosphingosinicella sp.]|jgi:hypothetical protein